MEEKKSKRKTYFKIDTTEDINRTIAKLVNLAFNTEDKFTLDKIRMVNELIKTKVAVIKQHELEAEIQELKDIVYANQEAEFEEFDESEVEL